MDQGDGEIRMDASELKYAAIDPKNEQRLPMAEVRKTKTPMTDMAICIPPSTAAAPMRPRRRAETFSFPSRSSPPRTRTVCATASSSNAMTVAPMMAGW